MIFENDAVESLGECIGDRLAQFLASGQLIRGKATAPADMPRLMKDARVRHLVHETESDERNGVRVNDAANIRAGTIDRLVERQLGRVLANALDGTVRSDQHDIVSP